MKKPFNNYLKSSSVLWLLSFLLVACGSDEVKPTPTNQPSPTISVSITLSPTPTISTPTPAPTKFAQDWERRWLNHIPCEAPCFEGVTPGKTSLKEAINILGGNPLISNIQVDTSRGVLDWDWNPYSLQTAADITPTPLPGQTGSYYHRVGTAGLVIDTTTPTQLVRLIEPEFLTSFTLGEIISSYGQPNYITANARPDYDHINENFLYDVEILYLEKGLAITTYRPLTIRPTLDANLALNRVTFFVPNNPEKLGLPMANILKWQGYKDFEFYCLLTDPTNNRCKS